jgi:hypothetical protein
MTQIPDNIDKEITSETSDCYFVLINDVDASGPSVTMETKFPKSLPSCYVSMLLTSLEDLIAWIYEGESVNRPQMDIKVKYLIFEPGKKTFIFRHILPQH